MKTRRNKQGNEAFAKAVDRAINRAARRAREVARRYGTPIYVWEKGRVVAQKP